MVGNLPAYMQDPLAFLSGTRDRYGDVVRVALGPMEATLLSHPDLVEDVLVTRNKLWRKDKFLQTTLRPVLGEGLLTSEGDFWRRQRRLAQPAFHRDRIAAYAGIMVDYASALASRWQVGETRDIHKDMMQLTLEIVAKTLFGADVGDHADDVGEALEAVLMLAADPTFIFLPFLRKAPIPSVKRYERAIEKLDKIIYKVIEKRRGGGLGERHDLLSMLLDARDDDGSRMSDRQLRDECLTLFLAGHETTAIALSWTGHMLSQHKSVDAKLARELEAVLGERDPRLEDIASLRYTSHVVSESLRLYPPAWSMGREACEDVVVGGYLVPRDHQVWFCPWSIQRDPRWFAEPHRFLPERWEGDLAKTLHRYAYFPFGGGPRFCIGQSFAVMEAVLLLATLARRFRLEILPKPAPTPEPTVTLRPKHGLKARLHARV